MSSDLVRSPGITPEGKDVTLHFGSRVIRSMSGQSLLAALVAAGEKICRSTEAGERRGMFCGMGVCQDCIVDIEGVGNQRACMTTVRDGMVAHPSAARPETSAELGAPQTAQFAPDLLVIGGGPAGLAGAAVAAEAGLDVLLIDERAKLGGQFYKQPAEGFRVDEERLDKQFRGGRALIRRAAAAGVRSLSGLTVWAAFGPDEIVASGISSTAIIRPKRILLATGAYERGVPMPGWTLPGFMTTGAAQTLLRSYQLGPGKRVLIGGNGPLNLQVAAELSSAGVEVAALAELSPIPGPSALSSLATMLLTAPDLVRDGLAYRAALKRAGIPVFHRHAIVSAEGRDAVERAVVARIDAEGYPIKGTEKTYEVDAVCTGFGFLPSNEIARALGCRHVFDKRLGHLAAERDERGRSSVSAIWIAGDCGGLGGARLAEAQGIIAGADIASDLNRVPRNPAEVEAARRNGARAKTFQRALWTLFQAPRIVDQFAAPDTVLCRCEEISLAAIGQSIATEIGSAGALKRLTRAGMGRCQGRYCGPLIVDLLARKSGRKVDEFSYFAPRMPFKPVAIGMLSNVDE
jgi:NADPH-dependent 2,4-dienoyl-CoA reductase/sulfur reductase-like enzyme